MILWWIRTLNEFEVQGECPRKHVACKELTYHRHRQQVSYSSRRTRFYPEDSTSLERIQDYITIEQEPKSEAKGVPPAYWPASGELRVEGLSARYSSDGPQVLHDISFNIKSGERVGVGELFRSPVARIA